MPMSIIFLGLELLGGRFGKIFEKREVVLRAIIITPVVMLNISDFLLLLFHFLARDLSQIFHRFILFCGCIRF